MFTETVLLTNFGCDECGSTRIYLAPTARITAKAVAWKDCHSHQESEVPEHRPGLGAEGRI